MSMRRAVASLILLIVLLTGVSFAPPMQRESSTVPSASSVAIDPTAWYPVMKVVDGDTISVSIDNERHNVRMIGIDTPETVDPRVAVECFGEEAAERAAQILSGTSVRLEVDSSQGLFDTYGRILAYVFAPANVASEGILVNELLLSEGYAHEYTFNAPYKYRAEFKAAEKTAREAKAGLWAADACAPQSP